jgi:hypothetical protein
MSDVGDVLLPITFTFDYEGHGLALASFSTGTETYGVYPSYVPFDPLFQLLQAVVEILRNGEDDTGCEWWYEPTLDRVALHRDGDSLRITIRHFREGFPTSTIWSPPKVWSSDAGMLEFTATCNLWTFAAQVRRAVRRLAPSGDDDPTWPCRSAEYRALCDLLGEHELTQRPQSDTSMR